MGGVSFLGSITGNYGFLYFGGIIGYLSASNKDITMKNCANYGSVTHSGTASHAYNGGIIGESWGSSSNKVTIQNCLNYGTITHSGSTTNNFHIGGILGSSYWSGTSINNLENCVSGGKIISNNVGRCYIGSIAGKIESNSFTTTNITHCYWTSDVGNYSVYGSGTQANINETSKFPSTQQRWTA